MTLTRSIDDVPGSTRPVPHRYQSVSSVVAAVDAEILKLICMVLVDQCLLKKKNVVTLRYLLDFSQLGSDSPDIPVGDHQVG